MNDTNCSTLLFYFDRLSQTTNAALAITYLCMAVITVAINLLLLAAMVATKQAFSNTSNIFITCLCVIDSLNGAVALPLFSMVRLKYNTLESCILPVVSQINGMFLAYLSLSIIILIAIDRYLHMRTSFNNRTSIFMKLFSGKMIILLLVGITAFAALAAISYLIPSEAGNSGSITKLIVVSIVKLVCIPGTAILYMRGYYRVRAFVRSNPVYNVSKFETQLSPESTKKIKPKTKQATPAYLRNLQKTVLMLIISLVVTYIPFTIANTMHALFYFKNKKSRAVLLFYDTAALFFMCSFTLNSLIIFKMNGKARDWVFKIIQCHKDQSR